MPKTTHKEIQQSELLSFQSKMVLNMGEIHIWIVSLLSDNDLLTHCLKTLNKAENNRVDFLKFEKAVNSYIISQGVLRILLAKYLNIPATSVNIGRHKKGKPYSLDDPSLFFNISNSGEYCVFAFTRTGELGVDLEEIRELPDLNTLIQSNFTENEKKYIQNIESEKLQRFFRFWTIKESYQKAIGEGMRLSPENIEFAIENKKIKLVSVRGIQEPENWYFSELPYTKEYAMAITYLGNDAELIIMTSSH